MQSRKTKGNRYARLTAILVALCVLFSAPLAVLAQETIEDAEDQKEQTREEQLRARAELDIYDAEYEDYEAAFQAASELVELAEKRSDSVETQLEVAQAQLRATRIALDWAAYDREQIGSELTDIAIRQYLGVRQENSESILSSPDLNTTMRQNAIVEVVSGVGLNLIDDARNAAQKHATLQNEVEAQLTYVENLKKSVEAEQDRVASALAVRERARDALLDQRSYWAEKVDELDAEEQRLEDFIRAEQRRQEEEARRAELERQGRTQEAAALAAAQVAAASGGYVWPTAGGIGSYFGPRKHPVLGYTRLHGGIDIGGRMGQPIWAAKGGKVIMARRNGGYGNCIVIDHGNGISTLYAHQSSFVVKKGDIVSGGQHIGNVGSTGLSTGPHLHFEIRLNGKVTDPLPHLPPL